MAKITDEDIDVIEKFVGVADRAVNQIKHFSGYMKFHEDDELIVTEGLQLLLDKVKKMKKAKSLSKLENTMRVKKVLKHKDGGWL